MKKDLLNPYLKPSFRLRPLKLEEQFLTSGSFENSDTETFTDGGEFGW